ncbi:MAG TPA: MgtC/SapB family protein [Caulobacterales bacterium]|nr:MgtC/SapB family protein [Caulobacterales bacterium]
MLEELNGPDLALRLVAAIAAGGALGFDRGARGRAAGIRTTILVCLAAAAAMIEATFWIGLDGKSAGSFVQIDVMRFPLGVLSGIGFIGAGVIVRRGDLVQGVSTAATLWLATIIGLCLGGGQIGLGLVVTGLGVLVLRPLRVLEHRLRHDQRALLEIVGDANAVSEADVRAALADAHVQVKAISVLYAPKRCEFHCDVQWRARADAVATPALVQALAARPGVHEVRWRPSLSVLE